MNKITALLILICCSGCSENKATKINLDQLSPNEDVLVTISTDFGEMQAVLYDQTPMHKQNFLELANRGLYEGSPFHRIIKGFMIQGGKLSDPEAASGVAITKRGKPKLPAEISPAFIHKKGALAAARLSDDQNPEKLSDANQFYIVQGSVYSKEELYRLSINFEKLYQYFDSLINEPEFKEYKTAYQTIQLSQDVEKLEEYVLALANIIEGKYKVTLEKPFSPKQKEVYTSIGGYPSLDGEYTIFGEVIKGLEVIDKITDVETKRDKSPIEKIPMHISLKKVERSEIEATYDFKYSQ